MRNRKGGKKKKKKKKIKRILVLFGGSSCMCAHQWGWGVGVNYYGGESEKACHVSPQVALTKEDNLHKGWRDKDGSFGRKK